MKGYEDLVAGLLLLVVVLVGGYVYLDSQVYKQKQVLQVEAAVKHKVGTASKSDKTMFETVVKRTE
jgi:hypothetical protein